jgi:hypothetical protein
MSTVETGEGAVSFDINGNNVADQAATPTIVKQRKVS